MICHGLVILLGFAVATLHEIAHSTVYVDGLRTALYLC
jgi:hypothetical protein